MNEIKNNILNNFKNIKDNYKTSINNYNKLLVVLSISLYIISILSALMVFIEIIELKDFKSNTGFIPSTLEFVLLAVVSWWGSQKTADRIIVKL
jgi:hypothetical protein